MIMTRYKFRSKAFLHGADYIFLAVCCILTSNSCITQFPEKYVELLILHSSGAFNQRGGGLARSSMPGFILVAS
jgi:hypothetical protein